MLVLFSLVTRVAALVGLVVVENGLVIRRLALQLGALSVLEDVASAAPAGVLRAMAWPPGDTAFSYVSKQFSSSMRLKGVRYSRFDILALARLDGIGVLCHVALAASACSNNRRLQGGCFEVSRVDFRRLGRVGHVARTTAAVRCEVRHV